MLALHGLAGTMKTFDFLGEQLGGDALQLVALDLRGRGQSETTPPGTYGWENHALDVLAVAEALGYERFAVTGRSMGASVSMKVAELDGARLDAVVLVDVAGRVDRGVAAVIDAEISRLGAVYESVDSYLDAARSDGLIDPWTEYWDRALRYDLREVAGGFASSAWAEAVAEDRAYTMTQHPYDRWKHLTMPTLLLRVTPTSSGRVPASASRPTTATGSSTPSPGRRSSRSTPTTSRSAPTPTPPPPSGPSSSPEPRVSDDIDPCPTRGPRLRYVPTRYESRLMPASAPSATTESPDAPAGVGRPRDPRIDDAVLQATTDLLEEVGYLRLTVGAIADRAGTTSPRSTDAGGRRRSWSTKRSSRSEGGPRPSRAVTTCAATSGPWSPSGSSSSDGRRRAPRSPA